MKYRKALSPFLLGGALIVSTSASSGFAQSTRDNPGNMNSRPCSHPPGPLPSPESTAPKPPGSPPEGTPKCGPLHLDQNQITNGLNNSHHSSGGTRR